LRWLARTLLDLREYQEAAKVAGESAQAFGKRWQDDYTAACLLGRCILLVQQDIKLPLPQSQKLQQEYGDQAIALLRKAIQKGYRDAEEMREEPDLQVLHEREDFQQLLRELEAKAKP
jgi:hypothetical protein